MRNGPYKGDAVLDGMIERQYDRCGLVVMKEVLHLREPTYTIDHLRCHLSREHRHWKIMTGRDTFHFYALDIPVLVKHPS